MSIQARNARLHAIWNHQETLKRRRAALLSRISEEEHFRFATLCPLPPQTEIELRRLGPPAEEVLAEMRRGGLSGEWGDEGVEWGAEEEGDEWCGYRTDSWDGGGEQGVGVSAGIDDGVFEIGSDDDEDSEDGDLYDDEDEDMDSSDSEQDSETPSDSGSDMDSPDTLAEDPNSEDGSSEDVPPTACLSPVIVFSDGPPDARNHGPTNNLDAAPSDVPLPPPPTATPSPRTTLPPTPTPPRPTRREPPPPPDPGSTTAETLLEFEASYNAIYHAGACVWHHCRFQEYLRAEAFQRRREREGEGPRGPSGLRNEVLAEEVGEGWGWGPRRGW